MNVAALATLPLVPCYLILGTNVLVCTVAILAYLLVCHT
jgi:hypothetical protein